MITRINWIFIAVTRIYCMLKYLNSNLMNMLEDSHCNFFIWKKYLETVHFWTSKNNSCYTWIYWISKYLNYNLGKYPWRLEPSIFWKSTTVKIFFSHFFFIIFGVLAVWTYLQFWTASSHVNYDHSLTLLLYCPCLCCRSVL
jgi:hypothetical protein